MGIIVTHSYKKLWKLLIDKDMKKVDLERKANISHYTIKRMVKNEPIMSDNLAKICYVLNCKLEDIVEIFCEKEEK